MQRVFVVAETNLGTLDLIDFGAKRSITAGEVALWAHFGGARFAALACATVSLEEVPAARFDSKTAALLKQVKAISHAQSTRISITKFLESPFFAKRSPLTRKGTKADVAEAADAAAAAAAAAELEEIKRLAAEFDANADALSIAIAEFERPPGDRLREGWMASRLLEESERREERYEEFLSEREAERKALAASEREAAAEAAARAELLFQREAQREAERESLAAFEREAAALAAAEAAAEAAAVAAAEAAAVAAAAVSAAAALAAAANVAAVAALASEDGLGGALGRGTTGARGGLELEPPGGEARAMAEDAAEVPESPVFERNERVAEREAERESLAAFDREAEREAAAKAAAIAAAEDAAEVAAAEAAARAAEASAPLANP